MTSNEQIEGALRWLAGHLVVYLGVACLSGGLFLGAAWLYVLTH